MHLEDGDYHRLLGFRDGLRRFLRWSEDQARSVGVTPAQHQLLLAIRGHGGPAAIGDIADHLLLRHHSVGELVDRAETSGLVRRVTDGTDHRVVIVELTAAGAEKLERLSSLHLEELRRLAPRVQPIWADLP